MSYSTYTYKIKVWNNIDEEVNDFMFNGEDRDDEHALINALIENKLATDVYDLTRNSTLHAEIISVSVVPFNPAPGNLTK